MPGDNAPSVYLDSCVFLAFFQDEPDRADDVAELFEKALQKEVKLYTSVLSLTEVAFLEQERAENLLNLRVEQRIADTFNEEGLVTLMEYTKLVAADARKLVRKTMVGQGKTLKPPDAIHLASALRVGANVLHTYDDLLIGHSGVHGIEIVTPPKAALSLFGNVLYSIDDSES